MESWLRRMERVFDVLLAKSSEEGRVVRWVGKKWVGVGICFVFWVVEGWMELSREKREDEIVWYVVCFVSRCFYCLCCSVP